MSACVLFFGGEKLSLVTAKPSVNGTFSVREMSEHAYSGIVNKEFVDTSELPKIFGQLISELNISRGGTLTIGVPSCFCKIKITQERLIFKKPKKITRHDIEEILNGGRPVYFKVDNGFPILDAMGRIVKNKLEANVSHLAVDPHFFDIIYSCHDIIDRFKKVVFLPIALAEANYLIDVHVRDKTCVLISSKMFTTSVTVVVGDQICALETLETGMAHVINEIILVKNSSYNFAKEIIKTPGVDAEVQDIVNARLEDMSEQIFSAIFSFDRNLFNRPFYICGGYIDAIPGAREIFEKTLGVKITQLFCPLSESNKPDVISRDAIVSLALT